MYIKITLTIILIILSSAYANTVVTLKNGTRVEGNIIKVLSTVLVFENNQGVMLKTIKYVQTSDRNLVKEITNIYPQILVEEISQDNYRLDLAGIKIIPSAESNKEKMRFVKSYSFNLVINSEKKHNLEFNAKVFSHYNVFGQFTFSLADYKHGITSAALGFGYAIDLKKIYLLTDINLWVCARYGSVTEYLLSPGLTIIKPLKNNGVHLIGGICYFSDGKLLIDAGKWQENKYYPLDSKELERGLSYHFGIGINLNPN
jgi:hypothetical protein